MVLFFKPRLVIVRGLQCEAARIGLIHRPRCPQKWGAIRWKNARVRRRTIGKPVEELGQEKNSRSLQSHDKGGSDFYNQASGSRPPFQGAMRHVGGPPARQP